MTVSLEALWDRVVEFGDRAYLVTMASDGRAHVVSVNPHTEGATLVVGAGSTTRANVTTKSAVTLLWPPHGDDSYSLIVDGEGEIVDSNDGVLAIRPTRAVLHRVAGASGDGPGCVPVMPVVWRGPSVPV